MSSVETKKLIALIKEYNAETGSFIEYTQDELMSQHTSFRIGGACDLYVVPHTKEELAAAIKLARGVEVREYILGRGTNVVFGDGGFSGAVISTLALDSVSVDGNILTAQCGALLSKCAVCARDAALGGFEFAHGIPGSCGGAVFMNAGAYEGEIAGVLTESTYLDTATGEFCTLTAEQHAFGYRESIYREHPEWIIVEAKFELEPARVEDIKAKMDDFAERRRSRQPLEYPSAGSTFKRYPGYFTAKLIDDAGLKGLRVGGAEVSEKHAGFVINRGGATAEDVKNLVSAIKEKIYEINGIHIECEILFVE